MTEPERTALYRLYDADDGLLYVGVTNKPKRRFWEHGSSKAWWSEVARHTIKWFDSEFHALQAEVEAITTEAPKYNLRSTAAYKAQQSATARAISPEGRRRRGIGVQARAIHVRVFNELVAKGLSQGEARRQATLAQQQHKADSGLFDSAP